MKVYYKQVQLNPTTAVEYPGLLDKPQINSVELLGNQDTEQIKVTWFGTQAEFDALGTYSPTTIYIIDDGIPAGQQNSYLDLSNKPMINGQVLTGNKQSSDLNIYNMDEVDNMLASLRSIKVVSAIPDAPLANTMYYVGPDSEGIYMVYLFDSVLNRIDLGESVQRLYEPGDAIRIDEGNNKIHVRYDDKTLEINSEGELTVIAADNTTAYMNGHLLDSESNTTNTDIAWYGTQAEYDAIITKNPETIYFIDDEEVHGSYSLGTILAVAECSTTKTGSSADSLFNSGTWEQYGPMKKTSNMWSLTITAPANEDWYIELSAVASKFRANEVYNSGIGIAKVSGTSFVTKYCITTSASDSAQYTPQICEKVVKLNAGTSADFAIYTNGNCTIAGSDIQSTFIGPSVTLKATLVSKTSV